VIGWLRASRGLVGRVLPHGSYARGASAIALGTIAAQAIVAGSSPILTRLYTPSEFGAFSTVLALLSIVAVVSTLAYEDAIPLPHEDTAAAHVVALIGVIGATAGIGCLLLFIVAGQAFFEFADAPQLAPYGLLLVILLVANALVTALLGWSIRTKDFGQIAANRITRAGTGAVAQIGLGLLGLGAAGLLLGYTIATVVALGRLAVTFLRRDRMTLTSITPRDIGQAAARYRRFPLLTAPAMLMENISLAAPLLIMVSLYGTAVGGQFALAVRVLGLPLQLISQAIGNTYFAEAARVVREDPGSLRRLYLRTTRTLALVAIGPVLLGAILAPILFGIIFGAEWTDAGFYTTALAPMFYLQLITNPTHGTLVVLERQDLHLQREVARLLLIGCAVVVSRVLALGPLGTVAALSLAGVVMYSWYGITSWRAILASDARRAAALEAPAA
jgi:O-antigen/teichoic acid export membrane protein